jgi:polyketide cyclase/dehydrase/lipid transport protein
VSERLALAWESCPALALRRPGRDATIAAEHRVARSPQAIHAFLADLSNHRHLTDRYLQLRDVAPGGRGGHIVVGTPLGLRRTARTDVTTVQAPFRFGGTAAIGRRTTARVDWTIEPAVDGACVRLQAIVLNAGPLDRALLAVGGRAWLRRRFRRALERLDGALVAAA